MRRRLLPDGAGALLPGHRDGGTAQGPARSRARLCRGRTCGTPTWPWSWPAPRVGERTSCASRWTRRRSVPASSAPGGSSHSSWPRCCAVRTSWPTLRATRDSASRPSRPCGPASPSWPPRWARCPRSSVTARCWSIRRIRTAWPAPSTAASTTRQLRSRLIAAGESWVGRFSWARCGAELEQLYRDARRDA